MVERFFRDLFGGGREILEDEIVALGRPDLTGAERAILGAEGFGILSEHSLAALGASVLRLSLPAGLDAEEAAERARALVPGATFDLHDLFVSAGTGCADCRGADLVQLAALSPGACRRGAPVAILDTGVDTGHPALESAAISARSFLRDGESPARDGHGTAVAALLVDRSAPGARALAPGAGLLAACVFREVDGQTRADAVAVLRGLDWVVANGARVVAMSLAGAGNRALAEGVGLAARRANLVAAAGNAGPGAAPAFPAAFPEVMAVQAVDARLRAYRSGNRGACVEIAAPVVDVVSAAEGGAWRRWSGTSFAVPFVAAALLRARAETRGDAAAARALLARTARDLGAKGRDEIYGHGLLRTPQAGCW